MNDTFTATLKVKNIDQWETHISNVLKTYGFISGDIVDLNTVVDDAMLKEIMTFDFEYETILL